MVGLLGFSGNMTSVLILLLVRKKSLFLATSSIELWVLVNLHFLFCITHSRDFSFWKCTAQFVWLFSLNMMSDQTMGTLFQLIIFFFRIFYCLINLGQVENNICLPHSLSFIGWCALYLHISTGREVCSVDGWIGIWDG